MMLSTRSHGGCTGVRSRIRFSRAAASPARPRMASWPTVAVCVALRLSCPLAVTRSRRRSNQASASVVLPASMESQHSSPRASMY